MNSSSVVPLRSLKCNEEAVDTICSHDAPFLLKVDFAEPETELCSEASHLIASLDNSKTCKISLEATLL